jgi:hypothetical protein
MSGLVEQWRHLFALMITTSFILNNSISEIYSKLKQSLFSNICICSCNVEKTVSEDFHYLKYIGTFLYLRPLIYWLKKLFRILFQFCRIFSSLKWNPFLRGKILLVLSLNLFWNHLRVFIFFFLLKLKFQYHCESGCSGVYDSGSGQSL